MLALGLYIILIAGVNLIYEAVPLLTLPGGDLWSPVDLVVGFVFIIRDFAQRRVGHHILWGMLAGIGISWWTVSPQLAFASTAAFAIGELADWALYTATKKPFSQRVLWSSLIGAPLDSIVFLMLVDLVSPWGMAAQILSKLAGAFLVFWLIYRQEKKNLENMPVAVG